MKLNIMKRILLLTAIAAMTSSHAIGQLVLDTFDSGTASGGIIAGTSWVSAGNVVQNSTNITIGGTANNDSGWGYEFGIPTDLSGWNYIEIIAQTDSGNAATYLAVGFIDDLGGSQGFVIPTASFSSTPGTIYIPLAWTTADPTQITGWNIGGGQPPTGTDAFRMTFESLALTATAVPEPSTYALMAGLAMFGFVWFRRRRAAHS